MEEEARKPLRGRMFERSEMVGAGEKHQRSLEENSKQ
jgi:hypothetical protein